MSLKPLGASGSLRGGEQLTQGAARRAGRARPWRGHSGGRAKQVGQHGHVVAGGLGEQQGRAAGAQHAVAQRGHLQVGRYGLVHAAQLARGFELGHEVAQVLVRHGFEMKKASSA